MPHTAWLIGDHTDTVLNDLTAPDGYPPADIWISLDATAPNARHRMPRYRSAWAYRTTDGEEWLDFAIPADTIVSEIGPHALAHPKSLTQGKALVSNTQTRDGVLMVRVPRYFTTVATSWTYAEGTQKPLLLRHGGETFASTLGEMDLRRYTDYSNDGPDLIITESGPSLLSRRRAYQVTYYTVAGTRNFSRVISTLRKLPLDTPIHSVEYTAQEGH